MAARKKVDDSNASNARKKVEESRTGPRGGTTTLTSTGMVKKNLWIGRKDAERLRTLAFRLRVSEADLFRRGLEAVLNGEVTL